MRSTLAIAPRPPATSLARWLPARYRSLVSLQRCIIRPAIDRKSTRLNSSHGYTSYAVSRLKKKRLRDRLAQIAVATDKFRRPVEQAQHVVGDQDLPVALRRCADADRRSIDPAGDLIRQFLRNTFHHDREGAGLIGRARFGDHALALRGRAALGLEAAIHMG